MKYDIVIIGGGEHFCVVLDAILSNKQKWNYLGYIDKNKNKNPDYWLGTDESLSTVIEKYPNVNFIFGIGSISLREKIYSKYIKFADFFTTVIHPTAIIAENSKIEKGVYIGAGAIVQSGTKIGRCCIINTGTIIEHDCRIGDFSHIAPGVVMGGGCCIGEKSLIGLGSRIKDHISIGKDATIGAGAVVLDDLENGITAVGIPARKK